MGTELWKFQRNRERVRNSEGNEFTASQMNKEESLSKLRPCRLDRWVSVTLLPHKHKDMNLDP